ncbi:MAG: helix-hairpin-helix domain-containing protein [Bacteroidota bacterium]
MNFRLMFLAFILFVPSPCCAQTENELLIEQLIEYISENTTDDEDYSEIADRLIFYRKYPLDINRATKDQFNELVFISPAQIDKLIQHRDESGLFLDLLELQSIDGFDSDVIRWLRHFLVLNPPELLSGISLKKVGKSGEHDLMIRFGRILQQQAGFKGSDSANAIYTGSADRILTRYRFSYADRFFLSLNTEKDAGEPLFGKTGKGFDFHSSNILVKGHQLVKKMIIGDYSLQFGQGLTMWSGLAFGKGAGFTTIAKSGGGLRPYSSVNEASFLRGISGTFGFRKLFLTPFISYRKLDASLSDDEGEVKSIILSGLHRTELEQKTKNTVTQLVYGANAEYVNNLLTLGITGYRTQLDKPIAKSNTLYERYDFTGSLSTNLGFHYSYTFGNTYFFGEVGHSLSSGSAINTGIMSSLSSRVSAVLLYRNYARNYHSFFNQGLAESAESVNEHGFYTGLNIRINSKLEASGYYDVFKFPWLKFRVDAPSQGYELSAQLVYMFGKKFKITGRLRMQQKEQNVPEMATDGGLANIESQNYRLELTCKINDSFSLRNRVEVSTYKEGFSAQEFGFLSYQDVVYKPLSSKLSGNFRFALFDTQSFNSRIYAFENDVLYGYSVPAYQGKGLRCYVNGRYNLRRGIDVWLRYAISTYVDQNSIGSGNDSTIGGKRSDVKMQVRFQF